MQAEVVVYRHPDEFPDDVEQLFAGAGRQSIALGSDWFRNFIRTVVTPAETALFYVLRREGRAIAAMAVMSDVKRRLLHRDVRALGNYYTALYAPALVERLTAADAVEIVPLIRAIKRGHSPMGVLRLQPLDRDSREYRILLPALRMAGLWPFEFYCFGNWFLRGHVDWPSYLAQRTSKMRSNIKRMEKKLADDGGSVEVIADAAEYGRALDAFERVYASSWKQPEPFPLFMPGLIAEAAKQGWLRLGVAWLKGQPIAAQVWFVANRKADIYKVAYDASFKDYSPGTVLTAHLMRYAIEQDAVDEVDYLIGDDPYKATWMSERRERWGIVAYNPRSLAGILGAARERLGRAARSVSSRLQDRRGNGASKAKSKQVIRS